MTTTHPHQAEAVACPLWCDHHFGPQTAGVVCHYAADIHIDGGYDDPTVVGLTTSLYADGRPAHGIDVASCSTCKALDCHLPLLGRSPLHCSTWPMLSSRPEQRRERGGRPQWRCGHDDAA